MTPSDSKAVESTASPVTPEQAAALDGQTLADKTGVEVALYDRAMFPDLLSQDPQEVSRRFAARFAKAASLDDLFGVLEGNSSKEMIGHKVEVRSVQWAPYESDKGIIPNAICEAVNLDTGEALEFATTSQMLTLFIRRAELIGALPFQARITGKLTRNNKTALNFERV